MTDHPLRIYVAGPLSADTPELMQMHADKADRITRELIVRGHFVFCPHTQSVSHFTDGRPEFLDYQWIVEYHDIDGWVSVCDAIYMLPDWERSKGAKMEHEAAVRMGLEVFYELADVPKLTGDVHAGRERMRVCDAKARMLRARYRIPERTVTPPATATPIPAVCHEVQPHATV